MGHLLEGILQGGASPMHHITGDQVAVDGGDMGALLHAARSLSARDAVWELKEGCRVQC